MLRSFSSQTGEYKNIRQQALSNSVKFLAFDSSRKKTSLVFQLNEGAYRAVVFGNSQNILKSCNSFLAHDLRVHELPAEFAESLANEEQKYRSGGFTCQALAFQDFDDLSLLEQETSAGLAFESENLTFAVSFRVSQPILSAVGESIKSIRAAGVKVKIVTRERAGTINYVANEIGIASDERASYDGSKLQSSIAEACEQGGEKVSEEAEFKKIIKSSDVYYRCNPQTKGRVVEGLTKLGHTVAVIGDKVIDIPALAASSVGITLSSKEDCISKDL